jgi:uncharacterized membrane protein YheB (UPF0754 family)
MSAGFRDVLLEAFNRHFSPEESMGELLARNNMEISPNISLSGLLRDNLGRLLNAVLSADLANAVARKAGSESFAALISRTFVNTVDVAQVVEDKINSLDTGEVEGMIFSFTKTHFKWINILGFVIGFLVGVVQVAFSIWQN